MTENVRKELASIGIGNQTQSLGGDYEKAEAMSEDGYYVEALINKDKAVYKAELPDES